MKPAPIIIVCLGLIAFHPGQAQPQPSPGPQADQQNGPPGGLRPIPQGTQVFRDLEYVPGGHERQKLDLYLPAGEAKARPLVIAIHGGAWRGGSKENSLAVRLVRDGYAVASINYRLSQDAIFPAQIEDCKAAVRWLRANANKYGLDPNRFAAWGTSAGGHLAALLGTTGDIKDFDKGPNLDQSSAVQAVVNFFGPSELLTLGRQSGSTSRMDHNAADSPESQLLGGALQKNPKAARRASPITYVSKNDPPMLLVHGTADPIVPCEQSRVFYRALLKKKIPAKLHLVEGAGHGSGFGINEAEALTDFLGTYLKARP